MLAESSEHFIFGTHVLLLGCRHETPPSKYNERKTKLYTTLDNFKPDIVLIEMDESLGFDMYSKTTDVLSIETYVEDSNTPWNQYDLSKFKTMFTPKPDFPKDIKKVDYSEIPHIRDYYKNENLESFQKVLEDREENAAAELLSVLQKHDRVAIHCGLLHMTAYVEFLEFLSQ